MLNNQEYIITELEEVIKKYVKRNNNRKVIIIFDHTTLDDNIMSRLL